MAPKLCLWNGLPGALSVKNGTDEHFNHPFSLAPSSFQALLRLKKSIDRASGSPIRVTRPASCSLFFQIIVSGIGRRRTWYQEIAKWHTSNVDTTKSVLIRTTALPNGWYHYSQRAPGRDVERLDARSSR